MILAPTYKNLYGNKKKMMYYNAALIISKNN